MDNKFSQKMIEASELIKSLLEENRFLKSERDRLSIENTTLSLKLMASERSKRSIDLATEMYRKGMIPREEIPFKAKEIMDYNDESFAVISDVVKAKEIVSEKQAFSLEEEIEKAHLSDYDRKVESKKKLENKLISAK